MAYKNQTDKEKLIITSLSSIVAGGIGRVVCHPIDTVKAKLQVETSRITSKNMVSNLLWKITKQTYQTEGLRGFYQGIGIATLGSIPALTLFFTSYEYARILLKRKNILESNEHLRNFTCGMLAEAVSCVLFVPIDVIKERLQVQSNLKTFYYKNTFDAIRTILKVEGVSGLYRAYGATLMSFGPFSALSLTAYDGLKKHFIPEDKEIGLLESIFLAGASGSIASIITNPMDLAKLRMQVQRAEGYSSSANGENSAKKFQYRNMFHGMYTIASNEGLLALFRGSLARSLYHTPSIGILLSVLDYTRGVVTKLMY